MSRKLAFRGGGGERAAPLLADFGPSATIFRVPSDGRVRTHPYLRLVAYYALLGLAVWLVISRFPTVPQLLERFREISVLGAAGGKGAIFQEAAAVRFRNTLKDTKDAVYIFLALAVGVAAGVFAPTVAAVMSLTFNAVVLALWKSNVGNIYADQASRTRSLPPAEQLLGPRRRASAQLAVGDPQLLAAPGASELEEVADRAARLQAYIRARAGDKKGERFTGVLLVHTTQPQDAQRVVEEL